MTENWKPIDGYSYEVSDQGRVRRILPDGGRRLVAQELVKKRNGEYLRVDLWRWNRRRHFSVHRLVAAAFLPPPEPGQREVNHWDTNTLHNAASNLEWSSRRENEAHKRYMRAFRGLPAVAAAGGSD